MAKYGEMEWDDNSGNKTEKKANNKDLYLSLDKTGPNKIRLLTKPFQYITHKEVKRVGDKGFGTKIKCSNPDSTGSCPLCDKGHKSAARWLYGVIDRKTGAYKVLDAPWQIYSAIKKLANENDWGDPMKYDLNIIVDEAGGPTGYYTVQPIPHKPLSAADQAIVVDKEYLTNRVQPLSTESVQKIMDKVLDGGELFIKPKVEKEGAKTKSAAKSNKPASTVDIEDESVDDIFPAYEGSN